MEKNHRFNTVPATEENLTLEIDSHPFNPAPSEEISDDFDVIVDGYIGKAGVGCYGGYSTRIRIKLNEEHPKIGREFVTKYFRFIEPGKLVWGHYDDNTLMVEKIIN